MERETAARLEGETSRSSNRTAEWNAERLRVTDADERKVRLAHSSLSCGLMTAPEGVLKALHVCTRRATFTAFVEPASIVLIRAGDDNAESTLLPMLIDIATVAGCAAQTFGGFFPFPCHEL